MEQLRQNKYALSQVPPATQILQYDVQRKYVILMSDTTSGVLLGWDAGLVVSSPSFSMTAGGSFDMYLERHLSLLAFPMWALSNGPTGNLLVVEIYDPSWQYGGHVGPADDASSSDDFAADPHANKPGVDTPDPLERLISQLKQLHHVLRG